MVELFFVAEEFLKLKRDIESYQLLKDKTPEQYTSNGQNCFNEFQKTKVIIIKFLNLIN